MCTKGAWRLGPNDGGTHTPTHSTSGKRGHPTRLCHHIHDVGMVSQDEQPAHVVLPKHQHRVLHPTAGFTQHAHCSQARATAPPPQLLQSHVHAHITKLSQLARCTRRQQRHILAPHEDSPTHHHPTHHCQQCISAPANGAGGAVGMRHTRSQHMHTHMHTHIHTHTKIVDPCSGRATKGPVAVRCMTRTTGARPRGVSRRAWAMVECLGTAGTPGPGAAPPMEVSSAHRNLATSSMSVPNPAASPAATGLSLTTW